MSRNHLLPSVFACATLVFAGAGLASAAHAHIRPVPGQSAAPPTASETSAHSWANGRSMSTAMGAPMGAKGGRAQKCSQQAFDKGLWGKARKRFINKCLNAPSGTDDRSMGGALGAPMGGKADSRMQKCSSKAFTKGLWGKARRRFMKKCLETS